ncbi:ABC-2 type transport system ATP-binding protein [Cytobacillus eiseniae]|uniref:ABC-2 type transport system ATP-binding protein n=1 Tax=Cytobacillus eiseniae TaxID=762947 RepID=A0ABS4RBP1_9BACI|nr:ABC transporter ATP-binding protein [Cytobacillus eiseniae]MBP2239775.1 ABC-2 type transport system ATP-binding protein [Cytobacillus eiseniae]
MDKTRMIKVSNLSKRYGSFHAVKNVNLDIQKGELFCFLGPNGAGKTTTIKMMTGLLEPGSGEIEIAGTNIWKEPIEAKKKMAYIPDHPILYPKLTGREFLKFIGSVYQIDQQVFEERVEKYLSLFQLEERADELIESYSHGMKQKINLCGAFIHQPDVLFLDEPTVGLDPKGAKTLKNLLQSLSKEGMTVFMSTHILEIAEQMCHRVGIINKGEIIAIGTMDELKGGKTQATLEDLFLELTGDEKVEI